MKSKQMKKISLEAPVRLRVDDLTQFGEEHAADLSAGWIFARMDPALPEGTHVDLEFYFGLRRSTIRGQGVVIRSVSDAEPGRHRRGVRIAFAKLDDIGRRFLERVILDYNARHPTQALDLPDSFVSETTPGTGTEAVENPDAHPDDGAPFAPRGTTRMNLLDTLPDDHLRVVLDDTERFTDAMRDRARSLLEMREEKRSSHT